jgi:hypothetical protein
MSTHMMPVEEPGRVLVHLVEDVRPLAGGDDHATKQRVRTPNR